MRRGAIALASFAGLALLAALVWLPLERTRARLAQQLPALRASIVTLERGADEARRLRALPAPSASGTREPLVSLATAAGGKALPGADIRVLDGNHVRVTGADIAFGALLAWLAMTQASQGLRVDSARIEALPARGRVRADLQLSRS